MTLADALDRYNAAHGASFAPAGGFAHGEVGASLIVDAGGRRAVAKWEWPAGAAFRRDRETALALVARLRARGARLPAYHPPARIGGGLLLMQEFLLGETGDHVPDAVIDDLVAHNALQAGAAPDGEGWHRYMRGSLLAGCRGYCEHASLRAHGPATRSLLARVLAAGTALAGHPLPEHDAVHVDFHHLNVLVRDGRLSGVVDCEGYRSGDRMFDLITLAFGLCVAECSPEAEERLWCTIEDACEPVAARAYVAHMGLRQVDWSIRHRTEADVRRWLARSEQMLARFGA